MLGNGCPYKGQCKVKKDAYFRKNYCDSDSGCMKCQHRPMNYGNEDVARRQNSRIADHKYDKKFTIIFFIVVVIMVVLKIFGS